VELITGHIQLQGGVGAALDDQVYALGSRSSLRE